MHRFHRTTALGLLVSVTLLATEVRGGRPETLCIFPAGGQRGTTVHFRVRGIYLHAGASFEMGGPGVEACDRVELTDTVRFAQKVVPVPGYGDELLIPSDYAGTVRIDADAPAGRPYWRVWNSQGVSAIRRFMIGDLPEVVEKENLGEPIPQGVELPVTANGRIYPREDLDIWSFSATKGQSVTCEVHADRLGSTLDPRLEVRDDAGHRIAENTDHFGSDSFLRFVAPADGTYHVRIHDIRFAGMQSSVYRLTMTSGPHVDCSYPLGGRRGETTRFELLGQALPESPVEITLPEEGPTGGRLVTPRLRIDNRPLNDFVLDLGDLPEVLEAEPNDDVTAGNAVTVPAIVNGRIGAPGDVDVWTLVVDEGESFVLSFRALRPGLSLDPLLVVLDGSGKVIHRNEGVGSVTLSGAGTYHLRIAQAFGTRGGPSFVYRLEVARPVVAPVQDFQLELGRLECLVERGGNPVALVLNVARSGGLDGEIALAFEELPTGVTVTPTSIPPGQGTTKITLTAGSDARIGVSRVAIVGTMVAGGKSVSRTASRLVDGGGVAVDDFLLAVAMITPFKFVGNYVLPFSLHGTVHRRRYRIDRGGYDGPLQVRMADRQIRHQQGADGPTITVPAGVSEFEYPLNVSTWAEVGLTSRTVLMVYADVADVADVDGSRHTVFYTSTGAPDQIIMQPNAGPLSISTDRNLVPAPGGDATVLRVRVLRDPDFRMPVTVELLTAAHVSGIEATPVDLAADEDVATLHVRFSGDGGPFNAPITVRARTLLSKTVTVRGLELLAGDHVLTTTKVDVVPPRFRRF